MHDVVSRILIDRGREPEGLQRMLGISLAVHIVVVSALLLSPPSWQRGDDAERTVMTISLGGAPGPQAGGMTPLGGRPVQQVVPTPEQPRPQPVRPPAAETPEMTVPTPREQPRPEPPPRVEQAPEEARTRTPTTGERRQEGSAVAETGGTGIGVGLSTGGGGTGGEIDVGDFCCPEYLSTMLQLIQRNWNSQQRVTGMTTLRFTVERDGAMTDVQLARSSGYAILDLAAQRAILSARLPPLPAAYPNEQLTIHLNFQYQP